MMSQIFEIVEVNPNDATGGAGCLCGEVENPDCKGPFAVFYAEEMASNVSPHPVLCLDCARAFVEEVEDGDILAGGERDPEPEVIEAEVVEELEDEAIPAV